MNPSFKLKYDQMRGNDPTGDKPQPAEHSHEIDEFYKEPSDTRNIAFVWPDGRRLCLNYGFLVAVEYAVPEHTIIMTFTSHVVTLTGVNLIGLFYDLMQRLPRQIVEMDRRYNIIGDNEKANVNEIIVSTKKDF